MAWRLWKRDDNTPNWKDYRPSRRERFKLRWSYNWNHRNDEDHRMNRLMAFLILLFVASIVAGVIAVYYLYTDDGFLLIAAILAVFVAPLHMWIWHFGEGTYEMGYHLTIPAVLIWAVVFGVTRTHSSMWLLIMSVVTLLTVYCINSQLTVTYVR